MVLDENSTVFDLLAYLCAMLDSTQERECAIRWSTAAAPEIKLVLSTYEVMLQMILKSALKEYTFSTDEVIYLNQKLKCLQENKEEKKDHIYLLAIEVERRIERYDGWQNERVIHEIRPLNANADVTGIEIYPRAHTCWSQKKSERERKRVWNTSFKNYMLIKRGEAEPFEIVMHYWNDTGMLKGIGGTWELSAVLAPIADDLLLKTNVEHTASGTKIGVEGPIDEMLVLEKVLQIFDEVFEEQHSFIVFPEALGTREMVMAIKERMRMHPEYYTFVLLPTICEDGANTLWVLGPGGVECLHQNKVTPFVLVGKNGELALEGIAYDRQIHLLITEELGLITFPICADLLDPEYYKVITQVAMVDTIICPSFSPGGQAFRDTLLKGKALRMLQLYVNTCSAQRISRGEGFAGDVAMVQLPNHKDGETLQILEKSCGGSCKGAICYFDLRIAYENGTFVIASMHKCA